MNARTRTARATLRRRARITRRLALYRREHPNVHNWVFFAGRGQWGAQWMGDHWQYLDWGGLRR